MFLQRRQSLRNLLGSRNKVSKSSMNLSQKKTDKQQRNLFRKTVRDRRNDQDRLRYCMKMIQKNWKTTVRYDKKHGVYKVAKPEEGFCFFVTLRSSGKKISKIISKPSSLSLTTCVLTFASDDQTKSVVNQALEANDFINDSENAFRLSIDSGSSSSSSSNSNLPIRIILGFSRSMVGLFEHGDSEFHEILKKFVEVTSRVRTNVESFFEGRLGTIRRVSSHDSDNSSSISSQFEFLTNGRLGIAPMSMIEHQDDDEGRLGMQPRSQTSNMPHLKLLTNPPILVGRFLKMVTDTETNSIVRNWALLSSSSLISFETLDNSLLKAAMNDGGRPDLRSRRSKSTPRGILKKVQHSKTARKLLSQFSTPEEAKVFELYMRTKCKRKAAKKKERVIIEKEQPAQTIVTESIDDTPPLQMGPLPKRIASLPIGTKLATVNPTIFASPPPAPPTPSEWNTPLISNKRFNGISKEYHDLFEPEREPISNPNSPARSCPQTVISSDSGDTEEEEPGPIEAMRAGIAFHHYPRRVVSEHNVMEGYHAAGGSAQVLY